MSNDMTSAAQVSGRHYVFWAGASQALNAGTNVLLTLQLAQMLPARDFATTAIGLAVLPLTIAGLRGLAYEPAVLHGDLSRRSARRVLADSALGGLWVAACLIGAVLVLRGPVALGLVLALGAFGTVLQDGARWMLFGLGRPRRAASLDLLWVGTQAGALALVHGSPMMAALGWTGGALASATVGCIAVHRSTEQKPSRPATRVWQWGLEYVIGAGTLQLAVIAASITGGLEVAGGLRGAMILLGGASVLLGGAQQAVAGRLRLVDVDDDELLRLGVRLGAGLGVLVALASLPLLAIGNTLGAKLLGATWPETRIVLPILVLQKIAGAVSCGPLFVLRKRLGHTSGVWWRIGLTVGVLAAVLAGAELGSGRGAAWALAVGAIVSVPIWMRMLRAGTNTPSDPADPAPASPDVLPGPAVPE